MISKTNAPVYQPAAEELLTFAQFTSGGRGDILFAVFLSFLAHAVLLAGLGFVSFTQNSDLSIHLVLVHQAKDKAPNDSEFQSYANQDASGESEENRPAKIPLAPLVAYHEILPQSYLVSGFRSLQKDPGFSAGDRADVLQSKDGRRVRDTGAGGAETDNSYVRTAQESLQAEILGVESYLGKLEDQYAKRPKIKRYTSIAAQSSPEAAYIHHWVRRVERMGNLNYPSEAILRKISGSLRLLVVLDSRGLVTQTRILEGSGHQFLDDAALRIVRLSAPFERFPLELQEQADRIEIIRTWRFVSLDGAAHLEFK